MHDKTHSLVSTPGDPRYRLLRSLQSHDGRARTGRFLIEGVRHVARAFEEQADIESLFVAPHALTNWFGRKLVRRADLPCVRLAPALYRELTLAAEPQGIGAVVRQRWTRLDALAPAPGSLYLVLEGIDSAGNLGTILRTAEAAGVAAAILVDGSADPHDPAAVRASMGSLFAHTLVHCSSREFARWAKSRGVTAIGSSPAGLLGYRGFAPPWPAALLMGSEKYGLSEGLLECCDFTVRIPMHGRGDSINVAVAAGVLLFEIAQLRDSMRHP